MNRRIKKVIFSVGSLLLLGGAILLMWFINSSGEIREYVDENGNEIEGSISEKTIIEINGVKNGLFINSKNVRNPVLLIISSGPGCDDYFLTEQYPKMHIDDIFTVVYWDYRGMGIAYDPKIDPGTITKKVLLDDLEEVTDYLKKRFCQEKIFLMGFSGGSHIGIQAVKSDPENYYAYIGMAQTVTDSSENVQLMYDFMKERFTQREDEAGLKKLDALVEQTKDGIVCKNDGEYIKLLHDAGGGTILNKSEFEGIVLPILLSHCYTIPEKFHYIFGMKMYKETEFCKETDNFDYRRELKEFDIPIYFISGEYDYNCPWPLVEDYCNTLSAPDKKFYKIKNSAHSPLWENAEDSFRVMSEIKSKFGFVDESDDFKSSLCYDVID